MLFLILTILGSCFIKSVTKNKKIPIPFSFLLLIYGVLVGILSKYVFFEEHSKIIEAWSFTDPHLMLALFVPPLIYESTFNIDYHIIKKYIWQILFLTLPGVLFSTCLTGLTIKLFQFDGFNWTTSFLLGSILSATDPIAVVNILKSMGVSHKLLVLIEGESLLNDGTAYCLFVIIKHGISHDITADLIIGEFSLLTFGGLGIGVLTGFCFNEITKRIFNDEDIELSISIVSCYTTFYISENLIHSSGILSIVAHGLYISYTGRTGYSPNIKETLEHLWSFISSIINNIIFVLAGVIIFLNVSYSNILAIDFLYLVILYIAITIIRLMLVGSLYVFFKDVGYGLTKEDAIILSLSGLRGEITLLLSLIVKLEFEVDEVMKDKICFYSAGIVILTILVNSTIVKYLVSRFNKNSDREELLDEEILNVKSHLEEVSEKIIYKMMNNEFYLKADWDKINTDFEKSEQKNNDIELNILIDGNSNREVILESRKIFLQCLKKQYWSLFDRHMLYKDVVVKLIDIVDDVLDTKELDWSNSIKFYCSTKQDSWIPLIGKCYAKCTKVYTVKHNYNIVSGYIMGQRESLTKLSEIIDNDELFEKLEEISHKSEEMGLKFMKHLEKTYPNLVSEIETNQVSYVILKKQEDYLKQLSNDGEITEKLYEKFLEKIHRKEYEIHL